MLHIVTGTQGIPSGGKFRVADAVSKSSVIVNVARNCFPETYGKRLIGVASRTKSNVSSGDKHA
jgi:hypothetical protein